MIAVEDVPSNHCQAMPDKPPSRIMALKKPLQQANSWPHGLA